MRRGLPGPLVGGGGFCFLAVQKVEGQPEAQCVCPVWETLVQNPTEVTLGIQAAQEHQRQQGFVNMEISENKTKKYPNPCEVQSWGSWKPWTKRRRRK
jgi:hypothetical protein